MKLSTLQDRVHMFCEEPNCNWNISYWSPTNFVELPVLVEASRRHMFNVHDLRRRYVMSRILWGDWELSEVVKEFTERLQHDGFLDTAVWSVSKGYYGNDSLNVEYEGWKE